MDTMISGIGMPPNGFSRRSRALGLSEWHTADVTEPVPHRLYRASASACFILGPRDERLPVKIAEHG